MKVRGENSAWVEKEIPWKTFLVSAFKKTGTSAELGPTSAFSRITTSTPDFPHVQVLHALVVPKASIGPETKQPPYSAMRGSTAEIPRRLHISPSLKLYSLSVHSLHPSLSQASPYLLHSKGCRNLLFHSWQNPHPHPYPLPPSSFLLQARCLCSPTHIPTCPNLLPVCFSNLSLLWSLRPPHFTGGGA